MQRTLRRGFFRMLLVFVLPSLALAQQGEQGLNWRAGDPFVFCRYGMKHSPRAWYPIPNYATSIPLPTPGYCPVPALTCPYPLTYLRGWTQDEINAYYTYLRICPQAVNSGQWQGGGDGTQAPFGH